MSRMFKRKAKNKIGFSKYTKPKSYIVTGPKKMNVPKPLSENKLPEHLCRPWVTLEDYLCMRRPAGSWAEKQGLDFGVRPLAKHCDDAIEDQYGNLILTIGENPKVAFSCHTDTAGNPVPGFRELTIDKGVISVNDGGVLGADDGTGMWLMSQMIREGKPGMYMFHREEEIGGLGSSWIASCRPEQLKGIQAVIALDRRGFRDVITHQGSRCCSDEFAQGLADQLGCDYEPDDTGVFTDSANYTDLVGECTNLSVGYNYEHSSREVQDMYHAELLRDMLFALDTDSLPIVREPGEVDKYDYAYDSWYHGNSDYLTSPANTSLAKVGEPRTPKVDERDFTEAQVEEMITAMTFNIQGAAREFLYLGYDPEEVDQLF